MSLKLRHIFFTGLLFAALTAGAQTNGAETLTVDEAVRIALDNNLSLRRGAIDLDGKRRTADRSWNSLIPSVTAAATASHPTSVTGEMPAAQNTWVLGGSVSASLSLSASTVDTIKKARIDYEAGLLTYEQAKQELELQVRKLFYQILLLEANKELSAQSLASAEARYQQIAGSAKIGQASRLEEMTARVDMENKRPNVRNAETQYENALDSFKTLLGIPREQGITLSGTLQYSGGSTGGTARAGSLEAAALQKSIQSLEAQRGAARNGAYTPALNLSWNSTPLYSLDGKQ